MQDAVSIQKIKIKIGLFIINLTNQNKSMLLSFLILTPPGPRAFRFFGFLFLVFFFCFVLFFFLLFGFAVLFAQTTTKNKRF
jgi:hypothetical protein